MAAKSSRLLVLGALVGAGVVSYLAVTLLLDPAEVRGSREERVGDRRVQPGERSGEALDAGNARPRQGEKPAAPGEGPGSSVPPGLRQPEDGPSGAQYFGERQAEVIRLLEEIQNTEDAAQRHRFYQQLLQTLRELGRRIDPSTRDRLIEMLTSVESRWRPLVGDALGCLGGDVETAKKLVDLLKARAGDVYTRNAIFSALGQMKVQEAVPALLSLLGEGQDNEELIVRAIGDIGGTDAQTALLARLHQPLRPETRREIEAVLGRGMERALLQQAADSYADAGPDARASICIVLGMTRDPRWAEMVISATDREGYEPARKAGIRALGYFGDEKSGEALLRYIDGGGDLGREATKALHEITNAETIAGLAGRWDSFREDAKTALMGAASRLPVPGEKLMGLAVSGLEDPIEGVRTASARTLGRQGRNDFVEPVGRFLDRARNLREISSALQALLKINTKEAAEAALARLGALPENQRTAYRTLFEKMAADRTPQ